MVGWGSGQLGPTAYPRKKTTTLFYFHSGGKTEATTAIGQHKKHLHTHKAINQKNNNNNNINTEYTTVIMLNW